MNAIKPSAAIRRTRKRLLGMMPEADIYLDAGWVSFSRCS